MVWSGSACCWVACATVLAFRVDGTSPALSVLAALSMLCWVLPGFTTTTRDRPRHRLAFAGLMSLVLYAAFIVCADGASS